MPAGAEWLATRAKELTGRWPTHVALTHYHSDHANGVAGYIKEGASVSVHATGLTRSQALERNLPADASRTAALNDAVMFSGTENTTLDLGGRKVRIVPRSGHTSSDVSLEIDDPVVTFCGDLVWNAMVPNYVDAMPTQLAVSARALRRAKNTVYVPGHGALAKEADFDSYLAMIDELGAEAKRAHAAGKTPAEAGANYALPASLGEWTLFNKVFFERAFSAWYRELDKR